MKSDCLAELEPSLLRHNRCGVEREMLRVDTAGHVARSPHPAVLGHKLTHPRVTVDFSEGLLELVTDPHRNSRSTLSELAQLHRFVARGLPSDEMLWPLSMPPSAHADDIAIADFGPSLSGRMKQVYRQGLATRYGKVMQIISGVHFNFSLDPAFLSSVFCADSEDEKSCQDQLYFRLIRGFDRHAWVLPYLFGASPVAAHSSVPGRHDWLRDYDQAHVFGEFATSLRMSDIGYQSPAQADLLISHRDLRQYVRDLVMATRTPWPDYVSHGVEVDGRWHQLNGNILQIENEYYSAIRPKQLVRRGERPACALFHRGVAYIEIRMLDVDPFAPLGLSQTSADFLQVFLLHCLFARPQPDDWSAEDKTNQQRVIREGRRPGLRLNRGGQSIGLADWLAEILADCQVVAAKLDQDQGGERFTQSVAAQQAKLGDPAQLPSARVLADAPPGHYQDWANRLAASRLAELKNIPSDAAEQKALQAQAEDSELAAEALAVELDGSFADYVEDYFMSLCGDSWLELNRVASG